MTTYADQLARLRVAAETGRIPSDLARWALDQLATLAPSTERLAARDALLQEAADLLGGSRYARARALRAELLAAGRRHSTATRVRALVAEALDLDPSCPTSERQLRRILE